MDLFSAKLGIVDLPDIEEPLFITDEVLFLSRSSKYLFFRLWKRAVLASSLVMKPIFIVINLQMFVVIQYPVSSSAIETWMLYLSSSTMVFFSVAESSLDPGAIRILLENHRDQSDAGRDLLVVVAYCGKGAVDVFDDSGTVDDDLGSCFELLSFIVFLQYGGFRLLLSEGQKEAR